MAFDFLAKGNEMKERKRGKKMSVANSIDCFRALNEIACGNFFAPRRCCSYTCIYVSVR